MIKGKKVAFRALERGDLPLIRDWRNIPYLRKHFREPMELNMLNQEAWLPKVTASKNDFMFMVEELATGEPVGVVGLTYINWIIRSGEISLYIGKNDSYIDDEGLAEDAVRLIIKYGFEILNLNKIWTELYEYDHKKMAIYEKFNMNRDGVLRDNCFYRNRYWDSYLVSILRSEYVTDEENDVG